ncbi:MAG TPA: protealysin inhibitor emfourin [Vicinamibacteria bacterium]|nr:protealysin inhibitor emfourin [Vicinamibacteria bacterium]
MRLELRTEGGFGYFPGLAAPFVLDADCLPEEEAQQLAELVQKARLFEREPPPSPPARRAADARLYRLSVESPAGRRTLVLRDPLEPELRALVDFLRERQRAAGRS